MQTLSFIVGLAGNLISILFFLSPSKTFWRIIKKKSVEDFKVIPYITTLLSASLWTYYGILHPDGLLIFTINGAGVATEVIFVTLFLIYAPCEKRISAMKLIAIINVGPFAAVLGVVQFALPGRLRLTVVGIICDVITVGVYASPLSIMRLVIRTKSVEYMPFLLSFFLFGNSSVWILYAVLTKDIYIGIPNSLGFILSLAQLILYGIYFKYKKVALTRDGEDVEDKEQSSSVTEELEIQTTS